ncbi:Mfa1 family fimbria major subunit [uncultured Bacteroides sp.]|uniref:Mfa1 family fimbria major subunit n=1 Tax=uncultured Bacteroides sp. TaxID=162156 RepID=UPI00266587FE|nr:Mfa1 family fimbria major subunit [uncultured Bacteroides sp.]
MKRPVLTYLFFFCLVLITAACKDDSLPASSVEKEGGSNVYVSIVVNTEDSQNSRVSTPTPGEDGDDPPIGVNEENVVHDLNVFFFHTTDRKGLNTTDQSVNVVSIYFDQLTGSTTKYTTETKEIEGLEIGSSYNVLVIANLGTPLNITTLNQLREYPVSTPIVQTNHFVMASSETGTPVTIQATSKNNPTVVSANVERLAARVDCHWDTEYSVGNDKVVITQAMLVNKYTGGTYAFKRVTNSTTDFTIDYLGAEKVEGNLAANYVIDPKTLKVPQTDIAADYQPYFPTYNNWSATDSWKSLSTAVTSTHNDVTYSLLDYTTENVVKAEDSENTCATYCTGIVFKAKYKPAGISTTDGNRTFYRYNGKCYVSLTDIKNVIGDQSISDNNLSQFGITKYQDGICYYTYWIKHAEDGDDTTVSPMEYAIVRNNIYQINVTGINDIGTVTPTDYGLYLECTVADWIPVDEITIDFSDNYDGEIAGIHVVQNQKAVLVAYSQDNEVRDAQFSFTMNTPVGIGWTAHLTNPDDFEFIGDYHGVGGQGPVTLRIHPRKTFEEGVTRETDMYITIDTDNSSLDFNVSSGDEFPGDKNIIHIQQVSTIEYDNLLNNSQN